MADLSHSWGEDLVLSPTGGLALASGTQYGQQRVLRRLMTNPGDDQYHTDYGAGLASFIGSTVSPSRIQATVLKQMRLEAVVSQTTPPVVAVNQDAATSSTFAQITYSDAQTGETSVLSVPNTSIG